MDFYCDKQRVCYKNNKSYSLKKITPMVDYTANQYETKLMKFDNNRYTPIPTNNTPEYLIKDMYYPYEFLSDFDTIKNIINNTSNIRDKLIKDYQSGLYNMKKIRFLKYLNQNPNKKNDLINKYLKKNYQNNDFIGDLHDFVEINKRIISNSIKLKNELFVFSGTDNFSDPEHSVIREIPKIGDVLNYMIPISTSVDIQIALGFHTRVVKNKRKRGTTISEIPQDSFKNKCCLYKYVLPVGYPICFIQTERGIQNFENEILLPFWINDKPNSFTVTDIDTYRIKFYDIDATELLEDENMWEKMYVEILKNENSHSQTKNKWLEVLKAIPEKYKYNQEITIITLKFNL